MRYLVLLGGDPPGQALFDRCVQAADCVVCADGALSYAQRYGCLPDVLLGDMDSVDPVLLAQAETETHRYRAEKDETDGQLAFDYAISHGADRIDVLGLAGGPRIDHMLGNIQLLLYAHNRGVRAVAYTDTQYLTVVCGQYTVQGKPNDTVSLIPLASDILLTLDSGFYYTVDHYPIAVDTPRCLSNQLVTARATLDATGPMLLIADCPADPTGV